MLSRQSVGFLEFKKTFFTFNRLESGTPLFRVFIEHVAKALAVV
jgi:hypothetical protein